MSELHRPAVFVLVGGQPGSGKTTLARAVAAALDLPLLVKDEVKAALQDHLGDATDLAESRRFGEAAVVALLAAAAGCRAGAVVDSTWYPYAQPWVDRLPGPKVEVRCVVPPEVAERRFADRAHDPRDFAVERDRADVWGAAVQPLGVGPLVEVDTSAEVDIERVVARILAVIGPGADGHVTVLGQIYGLVSSVVRGLSDADYARPTRASAWTVQDLLVHMLADARRALVTFATPTTAAPDVDATTYWLDYNPASGEENAAHADFIRTMSSAYSQPQWVRELWLETSSAAVRAAAGCAHPVVATQGHALTRADFVATLVLEATVHYLDLTLEVADAPPPPEAAVDLTLATLDGLLGAPRPSWDPVEYILKGTGRAPLTTEDRGTLGDQADRMPLLG